jgi:hypothetical protein
MPGATQRMSYERMIADPGVERRGKPRVACSYPAVVRGHSEDGERYEARSVLSNLSANGMYLRTKHNVRPGEDLLVVVRMSTGALEKGALRLAASGKALRVEPKADGTYGVAIQFDQHRFF